MAIYGNGAAIYGEGGAAYDITEEAFLDCCCAKGLQVTGISFDTVGSPDCFLEPQGSPETPCVRGDTSVETALALAINYIGELDYVTKCNPTELNPDPETNFCQNKLPVFTFTSAGGSKASGSWQIYFEVEDCGIPPIDYVATVTVNIC